MQSSSQSFKFLRALGIAIAVAVISYVPIRSAYIIFSGKHKAELGIDRDAKAHINSAQPQTH